MVDIFEYFRNGGLFMYPILFGILWGLAIIMERILFYLQTGVLLTAQCRRFYKLLNEGKLQEIQEYFKSQKGVLRNALMTGLENRGLPQQRVEEKMAAVLQRDLPPYGKYLDMLATLSQLMPIFGLLGTVSGMIGTFSVISQQGTGDPQAMADGISVALITTQAGLIAAVPMILGHSMLQNRLTKITTKATEACTFLIDYLKDHHVQ